MKTILFSILICLSQYCSATYLYVVNSSFSDSVPVAYGSQQWVDLQTGIGGGTIDSLRLYIQQVDSTGPVVLNYQRVFVEKYSPANINDTNNFTSRPYNADSVSRRVYFYLPQLFYSGGFRITTFNGTSAPGIFETLQPLTVSIINTSFNDSIPVHSGSSQWIDISSTGGVFLNDTIHITISHWNDDSTLIDTRLIAHQAFSSYYVSLPVNSDSSRRVVFTAPYLFPNGKFQVKVTPGNAPAFGTYPIPTGIESVSEQEKPVKEIKYYSLLGQILSEPQGSFIKELIYTDSSVLRKKYCKLE